MGSDLVFAELLLARGAELLNRKREPRTALDHLARLLAVATRDEDVMVHVPGHATRHLYREADRIASSTPAQRAAAMAAARQDERVVVYEMEGVGVLGGSHVIAVVVRFDDERDDRLDVFLALGEATEDGLRMAAAPSVMRLDARALHDAMAALGPQRLRNPLAVEAALEQASEERPVPDAEDFQGDVIIMRELFFQAYVLASVRARTEEAIIERAMEETVH